MFSVTFPISEVPAKPMLEVCETHVVRKTPVKKNIILDHVTNLVLA